MAHFSKASKESEGKKGFTLLELLIVIALLAVLATSMILLLRPGKYIDDVKRETTRAKLDKLTEHINRIKGLSGKSLQQMTGSYWTEGPCNGTTTPPGSNQACINQWESALRLIETEGIRIGIGVGLSDFTRDSYGSPFGLDENEGESLGVLGTCVNDVLRSFGKDGLSDTADDVWAFEVDESITYSARSRIINVMPGCSATSTGVDN